MRTISYWRNKRTEADLAEFAKQRDSLMQTAMTERKNQMFEDYLSSVKTRMEQAGEIHSLQGRAGDAPGGRA